MWMISRRHERRDAAHPHRRGAEGGFTVIEALVVFAILAGVLGTAYGIYADRLKNRRGQKIGGVRSCSVHSEAIISPFRCRIDGIS